MLHALGAESCKAEGKSRQAPSFLLNLCSVIAPDAEVEE